MNPKMNQLILGLELYNRGEFWECHEVLERLWKPEKNPALRLFLWVVIQVAGSFVLEAWGRRNAASRLFRLAQEKANRLVTMLSIGEAQTIPPQWFEFVVLVRNSDRLECISLWKFKL